MFGSSIGERGISVKLSGSVSMTPADGQVTVCARPETAKSKHVTKSRDAISFFMGQPSFGILSII